MPADVVNIIGSGEYQTQVKRGAQTLQQGGIVVLPTETVYGAAAVLNAPASIERLRALHPDEPRKPFAVHLARPENAFRYLGDVTDLGRRMIRKLWPGPVGLVFDVPAEDRKLIAGEIGAKESDLFNDSFITLRCPDHIVASDILAAVNGTVVLAAAGATARDAARDLGDKVDFIIDAGPTKYSRPSTLIRVYPDRYQIVRAGVYDERIIRRLLHTTVLFVCSGNTCRSPMAEAIARAILANKINVPSDDLESKGITVLSAGTFALPGARATSQAAEAVKEHDADLSHHRSRMLTVELIHQADVIFAMSRSHAAAVAAMVPSAAEKVETLDPDRDIEDPIGGDAALYKKLASQLHALIEKRLQEKAVP